jgi:hypothetical protein
MGWRAFASVSAERSGSTFGVSAGTMVARTPIARTSIEGGVAMADEDKSILDKAKVAAGDAVDKAKDVTAELVEKAKPLVDKAGEAAVSAFDKAKDVTGDVVEKAKPLVDKAGDLADSLFDKAKGALASDKKDGDASQG